MNHIGTRCFYLIQNRSSCHNEVISWHTCHLVKVCHCTLNIYIKEHICYFLNTICNLKACMKAPVACGTPIAQLVEHEVLTINFMHGFSSECSQMNLHPNEIWWTSKAINTYFVHLQLNVSSWSSIASKYASDDVFCLPAIHLISLALFNTYWFIAGTMYMLIAWRQDVWSSFIC